MCLQPVLDGAANLHGGHEAHRAGRWFPRHAPLHARLRPLVGERPRRRQLHLHHRVESRGSLRRRQPSLWRHARRIPRQCGHPCLSRPSRDADRRRHRDHHLRRPFRRQLRLAHGHHFLRPDAPALYLDCSRRTKARRTSCSCGDFLLGRFFGPNKAARCLPRSWRGKHRKGGALVESRVLGKSCRGNVGSISTSL